MSKIDEMRERHKREIAALQAECPHAARPECIMQCFGAGHPTHMTGADVRLCKECGALIERRLTLKG